MREMNFMRRVVGQVILASAIIDDSIGWIIVSIIFSLALHGSVETDVVGTKHHRHDHLHGLRASRSVVALVFFTIRWVNDTFVSEFRSDHGHSRDHGRHGAHH